MSEDILKDSWVPEGPISKTIKERIKKAGKRFHSNDNIAEFIEEGEMELLQAEVQEKLVSGRSWGYRYQVVIFGHYSFISSY